ncbi:unnamed protein product [Oreochromis niloticus]|nr:unnamed protein product [Mustela putorius furo]
MASLTSSSRRSSSSYRSSARYSTSSSYCTEGSLGGSSDSLDTILEPFLDYADHSSLFGEEGPGGPNCLAPFRRHSRPSYGHDAPVGGAATVGQTSTGGVVRCLGDSYYMSAVVSQFEPHDVVVLAYNQHVVIHAQKLANPLFDFSSPSFRFWMMAASVTRSPISPCSLRIWTPCQSVGPLILTVPWW